MANTLGTTNGTLIAQRTLETLLTMFPILSRISADFSSETAKFNQVISSRVVSATTVSSYNTTSGYVAIDRTNTDVQVTINAHKHHTYSVNDQERTSSDINLIETWAATAAHAIGKDIVDALTALILNATFANKTTITAAAFDRDTVVDIGAALSALYVPYRGRYMVLNSSYYGALAKDNTLVANAANPSSNAIASGQLPTVHGFEVMEFPALGDNSENLTGFAGVPEALVLATRVPQEPMTANIPGVLQVVTEPNTGLSILSREWYDMGRGKEFRTLTLMYGVAAGASTNKLHRIVSA